MPEQRARKLGCLRIYQQQHSELEVELELVFGIGIGIGIGIGMTVLCSAVWDWGYAQMHPHGCRAETDRGHFVGICVGWHMVLYKETGETIYVLFST